MRSRIDPCRQAGQNRVAGLDELGRETPRARKSERRRSSRSSDRDRVRVGLVLSIAFKEQKRRAVEDRVQVDRIAGVQDRANVKPGFQPAVDHLTSLLEVSAVNRPGEPAVPSQSTEEHILERQADPRRPLTWCGAVDRTTRRALRDLEMRVGVAPPVAFALQSMATVSGTAEDDFKSMLADVIYERGVTTALFEGEIKAQRLDTNVDSELRQSYERLSTDVLSALLSDPGLVRPMPGNGQAGREGRRLFLQRVVEPMVKIIESEARRVLRAPSLELIVEPEATRGPKRWRWPDCPHRSRDRPATLRLSLAWGVLGGTVAGVGLSESQEKGQGTARVVLFQADSLRGLGGVATFSAVHGFPLFSTSPRRVHAGNAFSETSALVQARGASGREIRLRTEPRKSPGVGRAAALDLSEMSCNGQACRTAVQRRVRSVVLLVLWS